MKRLGSFAWIALFVSFPLHQGLPSWTASPLPPAEFQMQVHRAGSPLERLLSSSLPSKGRTSSTPGTKPEGIPSSTPLFLYLTHSFLQIPAMIFLPLYMDMAEENFSLSQLYLQAPLSHSYWGARLVRGLPAHFPPGFSLKPFWKYKKLHLRLCQKEKLEKIITGF